MKRIMFVLCMLLSVHSFAQPSTSIKAVTKNDVNTVPAELITNDSIYWSISTISTIGYVNTTPGANYNSYKSGGGMIVKYKFKPNNRFEFLLYVQANTYGTDTEAWTQVNGTVEFKKDDKGQHIFVTHAEKGTYRITKNGQTTSRAIPANELEDRHSCTYLWEKTIFKYDPNNIYLLMVDIEEHPGADINIPSTIDPSWVSKFHIPLKK